MANTISRFAAACLLAGASGLAAQEPAPFPAPPPARTEVPPPAPAFAAVDTQGRTWTLKELAGKVAVLEWTNHLCPYVRKHYGAGHLQRLQKEFAAQGVVWLSVISSAPGKQGFVAAAEADELTRARGAAPAGVILDPEGSLGRLFGAKTTPHLFVLDRAGRIAYRGALDGIPSARAEDIPKAPPYLVEAVKAVLAGKPVAAAETRPYGCSVKYASPAPRPERLPAPGR